MRDWTKATFPPNFFTNYFSEMLWLPLLVSSLAFVDSTQQCNPTYPARGRYLKGHVISSENVKNIGMCHLKCSKDQRCQSINFHFGDLI